MRFVALVVALVACVHLALWVLFRDHSDAPDFNSRLASVSYNPYRGSENPDRGTPPTAAEVRSDLKLLAPYTRAVRTYSSTRGGELVPSIANELGLRATIGAWLGAEPKKDAKDKSPSRNVQEIQKVIDLARRNRNIDSVVVGNETIYRGETIFIDEIGRAHV